MLYQLPEFFLETTVQKHMVGGRVKDLDAAAFTQDILSAERPLLLIGQPGSGKSLWVRVLAARLSRLALLGAGRPVVVLQVRDLRLGEVRDQASLDRHMNRFLLNKTGRSSGFVVLCDGLDEIPLQKRLWLLGWCQNFQGQVLITSRPHAVPAGLTVSHQLAALSDAERVSYLHEFHKAVWGDFFRDSSDRQKTQLTHEWPRDLGQVMRWVQKLLHQLDHSDSLQALSHNPFFLRLVAQLNPPGKAIALAETRDELYTRATRMLLWNAIRSGKVQLAAEVQDPDWVIRVVTNWLHTLTFQWLQQEESSTAEVLDVFMEASYRSHPSGLESQQSLKWDTVHALLLNSGLFTEMGKRMVALHPTFIEHWAAQRLLQNPSAALSSHWQNPTMHSSLGWMLGQRPQQAIVWLRDWWRQQNPPPSGLQETLMVLMETSGLALETYESLRKYTQVVEPAAHPRSEVPAAAPPTPSAAAFTLWSWARCCRDADREMEEVWSRHVMEVSQMVREHDQLHNLWDGHIQNALDVLTMTRYIWDVDHAASRGMVLLLATKQKAKILSALEEKTGYVNDLDNIPYLNGQLHAQYLGLRDYWYGLEERFDMGIKTDGAFARFSMLVRLLLKPLLLVLVSFFALVWLVNPLSVAAFKPLILLLLFPVFFSWLLREFSAGHPVSIDDATHQAMNAALKMEFNDLFLTVGYFYSLEVFIIAYWIHSFRHRRLMPKKAIVDFLILYKRTFSARLYRIRKRIVDNEFPIPEKELDIIFKRTLEIGFMCYSIIQTGQNNLDTLDDDFRHHLKALQQNTVGLIQDGIHAFQRKLPQTLEITHLDLQADHSSDPTAGLQVGVLRLLPDLLSFQPRVLPHDEPITADLARELNRAYQNFEADWGMVQVPCMLPSHGGWNLLAVSPDATGSTGIQNLVVQLVKRQGALLQVHVMDVSESQEASRALLEQLKSFDVGAGTAVCTTSGAVGPMLLDVLTQLHHLGEQQANPNSPCPLLVVFGLPVNVPPEVCQLLLEVLDASTRLGGRVLMALKPQVWPEHLTLERLQGLACTIRRQGGRWRVLQEPFSMFDFEFATADSFTTHFNVPASGLTSEHDGFKSQL